MNQVYIEPIKIIRYEHEIVTLFNPHDTMVGILYNENEFNKIRIQIAEKDLDGYYIVWRGNKYFINRFGVVIDWPKGLYDEFTNDCHTLIKLQCEKHKEERDGK